MKKRWTEKDLETAWEKARQRRENALPPFTEICLGHDGRKYTLGVVLRDNGENIMLQREQDIGAILATAENYRGIHLPVRIQAAQKLSGNTEQSLLEAGVMLEELLYTPTERYIGRAAKTVDFS